MPASMVKPSGLATLSSRVVQSVADMGWEVGIRPGGKSGEGSTLQCPCGQSKRQIIAGDVVTSNSR